MYSEKDFKEGKVLCAYCNNPIKTGDEAMEHFPSQTIYHEKPCFLEVFFEGIDKETASVVKDTIMSLFGIKKD